MENWESLSFLQFKSPVLVGPIPTGSTMTASKTGLQPFNTSEVMGGWDIVLTSISYNNTVVCWMITQLNTINMCIAFRIKLHIFTAQVRSSINNRTEVKIITKKDEFLRIMKQWR